VAKNPGFARRLGEGRHADRELFPQDLQSLPDATPRELPVSLCFRRREIMEVDWILLGPVDIRYFERIAVI
jgi:hypothetical protein